MGEIPSTITGIRYDSSGNEVERLLIKDGLMPLAKQLLVFDALFKDRPELGVVIESSQAAQMVSLRGSLSTEQMV